MNELTNDGGNAIQILLLLAGITLVPALLFCITGFTRIIIVLGFIRSALGTPTAPPNQVLVGIAFFLTLFVMSPTLSEVKKTAWDPLEAGKITQVQALKRAELPMREFMFRQTRETDVALFANLAKIERPKTRKDIPTQVLIPAFILSELKTAFQIGFLLFGAVAFEAMRFENRTHVRLEMERRLGGPHARRREQPCQWQQEKRVSIHAETGGISGVGALPGV